MLDSLLFSVNAVFPILLLAVFGAFLARCGILSETFFTQANKFMFRITLPITLFLDVITSDEIRFFSPLTGFCLAFFAIELFLLLLIVPLVLKDNAKRGAFIQGTYRTNIAIIGVPLIASLFGEAGSVTMAGVLPIIVMCFNVSAVIILSVFAPEEKKKSPSALLREILFSVIKNPLIIGIVIGLLFRLLPFSLPAFAEKTLSYLDALTLPLALMALGASFRTDKFKGRIGLAILSSLLRCIVIPTAALTAAILLGFRNESLGTIFVIFGSCTAVASFVMSENMGSDSMLSGQIVMLSTALSAVTIFIGATLLRTMGFI